MPRNLNFANKFENVTIDRKKKKGVWLDYVNSKTKMAVKTYENMINKLIPCLLLKG